MIRAAPFAAGLVLVLAAGLKTGELAMLGGSTGPLDLPRWLMGLGVAVEVLLAAWLFSQWRLRGAVGTAGIVFAGFASVAAWLWYRGSSSCGCFGPLHVPPALTLLLDLGLCAALAVAWWRYRHHPVRFRPLPIATLVVAALAAGAMGGSVALSQPRVAAIEPRDATGTGITERVVVFRHDCDHCRQVVPLIIAEAPADAAIRWRFIDATDPPVARSFIADLSLPPSAVVEQRPDPWLPTPQYFQLVGTQQTVLPVPEPEPVIDADVLPGQ